MPNFPVDDEVAAAVWTKAQPKPFENLSFNAALRRTLGMPESIDGNGVALHGMATQGRADTLTAPIQSTSSTSCRRSKAPKADFRRLTKDGALKNGQELFLIDYQGRHVRHSKVTISGAYLQYQGRVFSMSDLARDLLKKEGYSSESVRGPAHWVNSTNVSIKDLWQEHLKKNNEPR